MPRPFNPLERQNRAFLVARCQARFRGEPWEFTFEEWWTCWEGLWDRRGRQADDLIMVRINTAKPWREDNVEIWLRRDWLREANLGNGHRLGYRKIDK